MTPATRARRSAAATATRRTSRESEPADLDRGPAGLQPGDRHPERRAGHVVQADLVEEVHRVRVAAVLAADAELQVRAGRPGPPRRRSGSAGRRRRGRSTRTARRRRCPARGSARRTRPRRRRGRSPRPSGSGRWCRRRRTRPPRRSARRSARPAAPRSSCRSGTSTPVSPATSARIVSASARTVSSSWTAPTSGTMISGRGSPPSARTAAAASAIARTCIANRPGMTRPSRTPRRPEHRVLLVHPADRGEQRRRRGPGPRRVASATATLTASSSSDGRNSCSGGSISRIGDRQPVHRRGRCSTKSARCSGSSASSAASRSLVVVRPGSAARPARAGRRGTCARCGTARCPRRRSGGPGPRPRRCRRWSAPPSRRRASACVRIRCTAATSGRRRRRSSSPSKYCTTADGLHRHLAEVDLAGGAVDRDDVALADGHAVRR